MDLNKKFAWSNKCRLIAKNNRVILSNRDTGLWIKLSKECYDLITNAIIHNLSQSNLINRFIEDDDRNYFRELFEKLNYMNLFVYSGEELCPRVTLGQIYFSLTNRCNLKCIHCSANAQSTANNIADPFDTSDVKKIIEKIVACNPDNIVFTGGEPLMRKDIIEILKFTSNIFDGIISLMTNGTLIDSNNVKDIMTYVHNIDLSIDGIDEKTCSQVRGTGVFSKVIETVNLLKNNGYEKISLSMVFGSKNYHLREKFSRLCESLNVKAVPRIFAATGRGVDSVNYFRSETEVSPSDVSASSNPTEARDRIKACNCGACRREIFIDHEGYIFPCVLLNSDEYKIANVNQIESISELISSVNFLDSYAYHKFNYLQPNIFERCRDCDVNLFCWPCLHELHLMSINEEMFNERCSYMKTSLTETLWG